MQHASLYLAMTQDLPWCLHYTQAITGTAGGNNDYLAVSKRNVHSLTGQAYPFTEYSQVYMAVTE